MVNNKNINKILIRSTNWIGDAVMTLPAVAAIRKGFPNAEITILAKEWVAEIFRLSKDIDKIIIFADPGRHSGIGGKIDLARELRAEHFGATILLQNAISAALLTFFAGIPRRAGYNTYARGFLLTDSIVLRKEIKKMHQTKYYLEMVKALGCPDIADNVFLDVPDEYLTLASTLLGKKGVQREKVVIGMAPGAAYGPAKRWPPERFAQTADMLISEFDAQVLLFGSTQDMPTIQEIISHTRGKLFSFAEETTLKEAIALIDGCNAFISNDSGLTHVSGALNKPTVAIFGSTNHTTTSPIGSRSVIVRKAVDCSPCLKKVCNRDFKCMKLISVDDIFYTVKKILEM